MTEPPQIEAPPALDPVYLCPVNGRINLHTGRVRLRCDDHMEEGKGTLWYVWQPYEGPELETDIQFFASHDKCMVELVDIGLTAHLQPRRLRWGEGDVGLVGMLNGDIELGDFAGVHRVAFQVGNFLSVQGKEIKSGERHAYSRMEWVSTPWSVIVDPVPDLVTQRSVLLEQLRETRGSAITHSGALSRTDGSPIMREDALDVLRDVGRTLSFARGAFSTPLLLVAYNSAGSAVWKRWSRVRTDPWEPHGNWFSQDKPEVLESVFAGWRALAVTPERDVVNAAAHIYLDAHAPGLTLESRLVLLQSALEGLADGWPFPALSTASAFPQMNSAAAARIARVAMSVGLPVNPHPTLQPNLTALPEPRADAPALEKMTWVRNSIAHLGNLPRMAPYGWQLKFEAKQLAALHLELAILRILNASGFYTSRLSQGHESRLAVLPWHV